MNLDSIIKNFDYKYINEYIYFTIRWKRNISSPWTNLKEYQYLIKEYLEVGVKNDDHLIKLAGIAQRALQSSMDSSEEGMFTDKEMEDLNKIIEEQKNKKKWK